MKKADQRSLDLIAALRAEIGASLVGQAGLVDALLTGLLAPGHVLVEGLPGLAKTLAVRSLAAASGLEFSRIQFTSDLLPADVTGTLVFNQRDGSFNVRRGPVFAQVVLADEINRAPAKVQGALLEAMEEGKVTIGDDTLRLPEPFFVMATQNPIEHEGTYPLPEAELDRFLIKVKADYPSHDEEVRIVSGSDERAKGLSCRAVADAAAVKLLRQAAEAVEVDEEIVSYMASVVRATRPAEALASRDPRVREYARFLDFGASPRAAIALYRVSRSRALLDGRGCVLPDDVKAAAPDVLRHRLVLSYEAEAERVRPEDIIDRVLETVKAP